MQEQYEVTLTGKTGLIHHADKLEWRSTIDRWLLEPDNKKNSKAGDDRTPAFKWIGYLYHERGKAVIPSDNLMTMLRDGGTKCPTGKGQQTFKSLTQSGIVVNETEWPIVDPRTGNPYNVDGIESLMDEPNFEAHEAWAKDRGFFLFAKGAKVGQSKHTRVRPRFDVWSATGTLTVLEPKITEKTLERILETAGQYSGLMDWRPGSKTPGPWGKFSATVKAL